MKRRLTATITALALVLTCFAVPVSAASGNSLIYRVGAKDRSVKAGQEFELKVNKSAAMKENKIKWTIGNTNIVKFDDDDRYDDDIELKAVKAGTTKVTANNLVTGGKIVYNVTVKKVSNNTWISRVGNASRTIAPGKEFELKVNKSTAMKENNIKWTIGNTNIVKFDDDDRYDDEIELRAVKAGTTKVTANNLVTGGKIVYTITVKSTLGPNNMAMVGSATKYVEVYDDLELKVRRGSNLQGSDITWTIGNTNLLKFENGKNYGQEVELESKGKTGTTKVTAHNKKTGGKIVYTVKVTPDYDD